MHDYKQTFTTRRGLIQAIFFVSSKIPFGDAKRYVLHIKPWQPKRSLAQNRLYWRWLKEIAQYINDSTGASYTDEDFHEYFKSLYLDYKVVEIFGEKIKRFKSSASLGVKTFANYLQCIEYFCGEKEIPLTMPADYHYAINGKQYDEQRHT